MTATTCDLLTSFQRDGFSLSVTPLGGLAVRPFSKLAPYQLLQLREHKQAIIHELEAANQPDIRSPEPVNYPLPSQDNNKLPPRKLDHFHIDSPWRVLSKAYYQHHFNCPQCICAGRGARYDVRCDIGALLWANYAERDRNENP